MVNEKYSFKLSNYPIDLINRVCAFVIDKTVMQFGDYHYWFWICIKPIHKSVLGVYIS